MSGLCSKHAEPVPGCKLCQADPREVFPDWEAKLKEAQAAGTVHCANCGHEYFRTVDMCPKCAMLAEPVMLIRVTEVSLALWPEVMWFINEWCKETGMRAPRVKSDAGGYTIFAWPPDCDGKPEETDVA